MAKNAWTDDEIKARGFNVAPRAQWSREQWMAYQEGWSYQRCGTPKQEAPPNVCFNVGFAEAAHFEALRLGFDGVSQ